MGRSAVRQLMDNRCHPDASLAGHPVRRLRTHSPSPSDCESVHYGKKTGWGILLSIPQPCTWYSNYLLLLLTYLSE